MIKIYIANLGKYNEGYLVGKWVDLPCDDLGAELEEIGVAPNTEYEEYAIHDYESDIDGITVNEYSDLEKLNELAERLEAISTSYDLDAFNAILEVESALEEALQIYEDNSYIFWHGKDLTEVAKQEVDEGLYGVIPDAIAGYIDYEAIGQDLRCGGYEETAYGVIKID